MALSFDWSVSDKGALGTFQAQLNDVPWPSWGATGVSSGSGHFSKAIPVSGDMQTSTATGIEIRMDNFKATITLSNMKFEIGTIATPWTPAPAESAAPAPAAGPTTKP